MSASCHRRKDFQKKVALPTATSFPPSDVLLFANTLTLIKHKGLFFNRLSRVAFRRVLILCTGTMHIYENKTEGWSLHVRQIEIIKTKTTRKMSGQMCTQIVLKTNGGLLILVVDGTQTKQWLNVFSSGDMEEELVVEKQTDRRVSLSDEESVLSVEVAKDLKSSFGEKEKTVSSPLSIFKLKSSVETPIIIPKKKFSTPPPLQSITITTSESVETASIRHGPQSVATLRNIIEAKARVSARKMRRESKSISVVFTDLMMAEGKQEQKEESEKKIHLPHLGKSISAPAILNSIKIKKFVLGMYDSCFDSYAGLIEQQNSTTSIDPTGRTDILAIIDAAQADGTLSWRFGEATVSFQHRISLQKFSIEVASTAGQVEIRVPLHLIGSVCYIHEQLRHLICISIAPNESSPQTRDIALLLAPSKADAESVCQALNTKFQQVFREAATENICVKPRFRGSAGVSSSSHQQSPRFHGLPSGTTTARSLLTSSDASASDLLAADLSDNELQSLIALITTYQDGRLGLLEYLQKLKELYGPHRKHLLPSAEAANGEDTPDKMSSSARPSSGNTGGGIRGFFSKLRKPSDQMHSGNSTVQVGSRTFDVAEVQKIIPQLEDTIQRKDAQLKQSQIFMDANAKRISELEQEVRALQRECDKLRSVLDQKTTTAASPGAPSSPSPKTDQLGNDLAQEDPNNKRSLYKRLLSQASQKAVLPNDTTQRAKKLAVSAEPTNFEQTKTSLQHHSKTAGSKQLIRDAVQKNDFLKQLAKEQIIELVECMYEMRARAGQWVIQEGEPGDRLFVVAEGELQVSREGQSLGTMRAGTVMGELAILYNCTRTASIQATTDVQLWVLDRSVFQMITQRLGMERHAQLMNFLNKVSIFEKLNEDRISKIADVLDQDYYAGGHYIIRQGEKGDAFFIINSGQVKVTQLIEGESEPREIRVLSQGDFFGERALLGEEVRTANIIAQAPGVEVLTLDRDSFVKLIGDIEGVKKDYGDKERLATVIHEPPSPVKEDIRAEFVDVKLSHIKRIATLGVGGFGRVELVCLNGDKNRTFALKALKKKHIVDTRQQEHIFAERNIMMETSSEWIVKLFKTFRDNKYVYMLLEVCLGGELWTTLRDRGHFDDYTARFFVACVLEGLEYLHRKNIVYRDLKPENCLLTNTGYLKLVDFGFAKKLASGRKTWTFCGTPEYVSPEIILNKGHDQAADYWALGIYICELMLGRPPFQASDPMKTYTLILKGVDALEIPNRRIGKTATALVKKLCRDNPGERLGSGSGGVNDIRKHRWFMGFDWEGLRSRSLKAPILPKVSNPADVTNFDNYPPDLDVPPDEFSGWDEGF